MIAATNSWVLGIDNLSGVPHSLADALCRLATGGGLSTRELYSDAEEVIFNASRPVILNGIEDLATREDLADRAIVVTLPPIRDRDRRPEREFWHAFTSALPAILGALLTTVSAAMSNVETILLSSSPRMADFVQWVIAAEPALGWPPGLFLEVYSENRNDGTAAALEDDPVAGALLQLLADLPDWRGTATDLLTSISKGVEETVRKGRSWPQGPRGLGDKIRRIGPLLRRSGVEVEFRKESRKRIIRFRTTTQAIVSCVSNITGCENTAVDTGTQTDIVKPRNVSQVDSASPTTDSGTTVGDKGDDRDARAPDYSYDLLDSVPTRPFIQTPAGDCECLRCGDLFGSQESCLVHIRESNCSGDVQ